MGYEGLVWDHRRPYPRDQGIQFELLNDFEALKSQEVFRQSNSMEQLIRALNPVLEYLDNENALRRTRDERQETTNQDDTGDS